MNCGYLTYTKLHRKVESYQSYHYLERAGFSLDLRDHLENPEHHPCVMGCDILTPMDIRLSNIHQTTNPLISRPLSEKY